MSPAWPPPPFICLILDMGGGLIFFKAVMDSSKKQRV